MPGWLVGKRQYRAKARDLVQALWCCAASTSS
jgi:hypothetical protein